MKLDMRTPDQQLYDAVTRGGERHQVNWVLEDLSLKPRFRCLHGTLPAGFACAAEVLTHSPELMFDGYEGKAREARDGIIVSRWSGRGPNSDPKYDTDFSWHYEDEAAAGPVATQRHTVRFVIGPDNIDPVFECLHPEDDRCDAETWREDLWAFPEWHTGPSSAAQAGTIVSWWKNGQPNDTDFPHWAYEKHAPAILAGITVPAGTADGGDPS